MSLETASMSFTKQFRVSERISVATYARALGEEDGPLVSRVAAIAAGLPGRPVPPSLLSFFHTCDAEDLLQRFAIKMGKTLFVGAEGRLGALLYEDDEVIGTTRLKAEEHRSSGDGAKWRHLTFETTFTTTSKALVSTVETKFMERLA